MTLFSDETWETLDRKARLEALQSVLTVECTYLGVEVPHLKASKLKESVLGCYIDEREMILLSVQVLEDPGMSLLTLCHEARHAYQHRLVELYESAEAAQQNLLLLRDAAFFAEEFDCYISEDYERYASQHCETDARTYAKNALQIYLPYLTTDASAVSKG